MTSPNKEQPQTVDLKGEYIEHIHLLSSNEAGWQNLNLIYEKEPAGEMPETHLNQHMLIICLGNFQANYLEQGHWQHQDYSQGDIVICPAQQTFPKTQIDREVPLLQLFIEPTTLAQIKEVDTKQIELIPNLKLRDPLIQQMGLALKTELELGGSDSHLYAEAMSTALAVHLLRRYSSKKQEIREYRGGLPKYKLRQVLSYIDNHLNQKLALAELAALVPMSSHYFASLFKESMGISPYQYITKCRVEKAKQLLAKTDLSIVAICQEVGFESQSHFTRVFRQHAKTTPNTYRKAL